VAGRVGDRQADAGLVDANWHPLKGGEKDD